MTAQDYLQKWIKETYPMMDSYDYGELDYYDMQKFAGWIVKLLATPAVSKCEGLQGRELLLAEFYDYLLPYGQYPNVKELRINDFLSKQ
jgi:hypothetical protein